MIPFGAPRPGLPTRADSVGTVLDSAQAHLTKNESDAQVKEKLTAVTATKPEEDGDIPSPGRISGADLGMKTEEFVVVLRG